MEVLLLNFFEKILINYQEMNSGSFVHEEDVRNEPVNDVPESHFNTDSSIPANRINITFYYAIEKFIQHVMKNQYTDKTVEDVLLAIVFEYGLVKIKSEENLNAILKVCVEKGISEEKDADELESIIDRMVEFRQIEFLETDHRLIIKTDMVLYENRLLMTYFDIFSYEQVKTVTSFNHMCPVQVMIRDEFIGIDGRLTYHLLINDVLLIVNERVKDQIIHHFERYNSRFSYHLDLETENITTATSMSDTAVKELTSRITPYQPEEYQMNPPTVPITLDPR